MDTGQSPRTPAAAAARGYRSAEDRRRFALAAGIMAGACLAAQFVLPFVIMLALMPFFMFSVFSSMEMASPGAGASWDGGIWYVAESESPFAERSGGNGPWLCRLTPGSGSGPERVGTLALPTPSPSSACSPVREPVLLAGRDRLWIVSDAAVGFYRDGRLTFPSEDEAPGDVSRPFLRGGRPAVVAGSPSGPVVKVLENGRWREAEPAPWLADVESLAGLRVVEAGGELHAFLRERAGLYHRRSSARGRFGSWRPVGAGDCGHWTALELGGRPTLFSTASSPDGVMVGRRYEDGTWREFFSHRVFAAGELGAFPGEAPGGFRLLYQTFPGRVTLLDVPQGRAPVRTGYGRGFPFSGGFVWVAMLLSVLPMILSLGLACVLSGRMRAHREDRYGEGPDRASFAPLWRRALALTIDGLIAGGPVAAAYVALFSRFGDFEDMMDPVWMIGGMLFMAAGTVWALTAFLIFRFMEGRSGQTPGKRALGIRAVGLDLRPCGLGRSLIRGLLLVVDGFFGYLVGIVLIAFTENWQRLGDMAAKTIVIRTDGR